MLTSAFLRLMALGSGKVTSRMVSSISGMEASRRVSHVAKRLRKAARTAWETGVLVREESME